MGSSICFSPDQRTALVTVAFCEHMQKLTCRSNKHCSLKYHLIFLDFFLPYLNFGSYLSFEDYKFQNKEDKEKLLILWLSIMVTLGLQ